MAFHRFSFNNGEISPDLHYRSDLTKFYSSCRTMENNIPIPQGGASRRPGWEAVMRLDFGTPSATAYRLLVFEISSTERYHVVLAANPNTTGPDDVTNITIYSDIGQTLQTITAAYLPTEYVQIQSLLLNDVMFLFHENHHPLKLSRVATTTWELELMPFNGGPWARSSNQDKTLVMAIDANRYLAATTYDTGDYSYTGTEDTLTGVASKLFRSRFSVAGRGGAVVREYYDTCIGTTALPSVTGFAVGDRIQIEGISTLAGEWKITEVDETNKKIYLDTGTVFVNGIPFNDYTGVNVSSDTVYRVGSRPTHWQSLQDGNTGNDPPSSPDFWVERNSIYGAGFTASTSSNFYSAADVGRRFRMQYDLNISDSQQWDDTEQGSFSKILPAFGSVTMRTQNGIWDGEVALQQSLDGGATWDDIGVIQSKNGTSNGEIIREITEYNVLIRAYLRKRNTAPSDSGCNLYLEVTGVQYAYYRVDTFNDERSVDVTLENYIPDYVATWKWSRDLFGGSNGYPSCAAIYQERMVLSGIPGEPSVLAFSATDDFEHWQPQSLASTSFVTEFATAQRWPVRWMVPKKVLLFGTERGEWSLSPSAANQAIAPGQFFIEEHTSRGSAAHQALSSSDLMIHIAAGSREIRAMRYSFEKDGYESDLLNFFATHIGNDSPFREFAYVRSPQEIVYVVRDNGELASYVYDRAQQVNAWSRHPMPDGHAVLSVGTARNSVGNDDLWAVVRREDGTYLERLRTDNYTIDGAYNFENVDTKQLYVPYSDEPAFVAYDNTLRTGETQQANWSGMGRFVVVNPAVSQLVVKEDGVALNVDEDYIVLNTPITWLWIPRATGTLTLFDFTTPLVENTEWYQFTADSTQCARVINPALDSSTLDWIIDLTPSNDINHIPQANDFVLFPDSLGATISGFDGLIPLTPDVDFVVYDVPILFSAFAMENPETMRIGIQMASMLAPTDLLAGPDVGGPGGSIKVSQVEVYVQDGAGGEISLDNGTNYDTIKFQPANALVTNTVLGLFSGKFIVDMASGRSDGDGLLMQIRNTSAYPQTITNIGVRAHRNRK